MPTPEQIYEALEARRSELGLSQAEVCSRAFGKSDNAAFQALRRGSSPAADKLAALCGAVGWEFYFGPPRETGPVEEVRLDSDSFAHVPVHRASLAAGDGVSNGSETVIDHLAFRRSWLSRLGISASNAVIARAHGESMSPTIHAGDMLLIDRSQNQVPVRKRAATDRRPAPIYALLADGMARVKRIERPEDGIVIIASDNPEYGPEAITGSKIDGLNIIGKVMWWGHTNRE